MNNSNNMFLKTLKGMISSFFIVPLVIAFLALSDLFLFKSYGFASFVSRYIMSFFSNTPLDGWSQYSIIIILFYLLSIALLYTSLLTYLIKKTNDSNTNIGQIFLSVKNTYFRTLLAYIYTIISFGLILQIIKQIFLSIGQMINPFIGITMSETIGYYIFSVILFAVCYSIDKDMNVKNLSISVFKYVFSKSTLSLLLFLLIFNGIYSFIQMKVIHYIYSSIMNSLTDGSSVLNFFNKFSMSDMPIWYKCIDWGFKGIIISFILIYVCMMYFNKDKELVSNKNGK